MTYLHVNEVIMTFCQLFSFKILPFCLFDFLNNN